MHDRLFDQYDLAGLELPNRLVMAPLTRMRASADGVMGEMNADYYAQRASAGLIVAEGAFPHHSGKSYPGQPGLETPAQIDGWRGVTDAVHSAGGRIFVQVMHGGRISHERIIPGGLQPVAPSAVRPEGLARIEGEKLPLPVPRAIGEDEIAEVQEHFVGIRISPAQNVNDISETDALATYPLLLAQLAPLGLAYVHVMESPPDTGWSAVDLVREHWDGTLIVNSNFPVDWPPDVAERVIAEDRGDLYCYGRRFISNPDLVERIRTGAPIAEADMRTFYGGGREGYTDYPTLAESGSGA